MTLSIRYSSKQVESFPLFWLEKALLRLSNSQDPAWQSKVPLKRCQGLCTSLPFCSTVMSSYIIENQKWSQIGWWPQVDQSLPSSLILWELIELFSRCEILLISADTNLCENLSRTQKAGTTIKALVTEGHTVWDSLLSNANASVSLMSRQAQIPQFKLHSVQVACIEKISTTHDRLSASRLPSTSPSLEIQRCQYFASLPHYSANSSIAWALLIPSKRL